MQERQCAGLVKLPDFNLCLYFCLAAGDLAVYDALAVCGA
jgi:hypothetical protein